MRLALGPKSCQQQLQRTSGIPLAGNLRTYVQKRTCIQAHRGGTEGSDADNSCNRRVGATLSAHHTWLRRQRVLHVEPHPSDADILELNVGGTQMVTCRSTLRQVPGSLLAVLFDPANQHLLNRDAAGRVFLDHDPAAFSLVLRYLRELKITGGCTSSVLLPPIPPADAASFRSLVTHLGLQIDEAAITAATARGAAIAAAAASAGTAYSRQVHGGTSGIERSASPYASKPAKGSACSNSVGYSSQQYQQWQKHQYLIRPQPPELPPSGCTSKKPPSSATFSSPFRLVGPQAQHVTPAASNSSSSVDGSNRVDRSPPVRTAKPQQKPFVESSVQYYHINTSPVVKLAANADSTTSAAAPLKLTVRTEADILAQQQQLQQQRNAPGGSSLYNSSSSPFSPRSFLSGCDVFCTTSSSKQLLTLSVVARSSAGVDNMFVGVTSPNHTDQRGPQIPCFGWRQLEICEHSVDTTEQQQDDLTLGELDPATDVPSSSSHQGNSISSSEGQHGPQVHPTTAKPSNHRQLWQCGDLVQLEVELGLTNRLLLKVNGQEVPGSCNNNSMLELPTFRQWCWYLALFRGTEVAAVVFEQDSMSIYSGDYKLKRYLG